MSFNPDIRDQGLPLPPPPPTRRSLCSSSLSVEICDFLQVFTGGIILVADEQDIILKKTKTNNKQEFVAVFLMEFQKNTQVIKPQQRVAQNYLPPIFFCLNIIPPNK